MQFIFRDMNSKKQIFIGRAGMEGMPVMGTIIRKQLTDDFDGPISRFFVVGTEHQYDHTGLLTCVMVDVRKASRWFD